MEVQDAPEGVQSAAEQPDTQVNETEGAAQETETPETETETAAPKPQNDPEKLAKALARKDRRIGEKTAIINQLRRELEEAKTPKAQPQAETKSEAKKLNVEDFESVEAYLDAKIEAAAEKKAKAYVEESEKKSKTASETEKAKAAREASLAQFQKESAKLAKTIPDFNDVMSENSDVMFGNHVIDALHESDNGPLAAYYALKHDLVDELNGLTPAKAAIKVGRILDKAEAEVEKPKPVSKTPAPIKSNPGTSAGRKSPDAMSASETVSWLLGD